MSTLPFEDTTDFDDAERGLIGSLQPCVVRADNGGCRLGQRQLQLLAGQLPGTVHPSLWRQSGLSASGLYQVTAGIYQIRGLDLSNMTLIEGERGLIVIDPLVSAETAAAGLALYRAHRGDRPVTGLIYTHSHVDHFGGALGVMIEVDQSVPVLAPAGFLEHAVAENIYAGTAMARRAAYMYGAVLPRGPQGQVGSGLGNQFARQHHTARADAGCHPHRSGRDDRRRPIVFQITPGTEAPAEMNFYFPDHRALCMAENATHNLHNLVTLRGALVRDPHLWAKYLTEAINLYARDSDVVFASHHWPTWGTEQIVEYLSQQRDLYAYLNDQTLRLLNQGYVGSEIAEDFQTAARVGKLLARTRLLRFGQPQCQGHLPALPGLVRRQPLLLWEHPPVGAGQTARGVHGRPVGGDHQGAGLRRCWRSAFRRPAAQARGVRGPGLPPGQGTPRRCLPAARPRSRECVRGGTST